MEVNVIMRVSIKADLGMTICDGTWDLSNACHVEPHQAVKQRCYSMLSMGERRWPRGLFSCCHKTASPQCTPFSNQLCNGTSGMEVLGFFFSFLFIFLDKVILHRAV